MRFLRHDHPEVVRLISGGILERLLFPFVVVGIELFYAVRTDPMAEFGFGMVTDICFNLIPIPLIVTNSLA